GQGHGGGGGAVPPPHRRAARFEQGVGFRLNPAGHVGVRGAAVRRVVLDATILWRVVRWRDDDAVRQVLTPPAVPGQDGVRNSRRRRAPVVGIHSYVHFVRAEHVESGLEGRR